MSNNSAANSSLVIAQKAVKQLRLEASVRRIKVSTPRFAAELNTITPLSARDSRPEAQPKLNVAPDAAN